MTDEKKPDNVVFNVATQRYDAALKPYATSVGAPVITTTDTTTWKNRSINKVNHKIKVKYLELKSEYEKMMCEFEHNTLIFNSNLALSPSLVKFITYTKGKKGIVFFRLLHQGNAILNI